MSNSQKGKLIMASNSIGNNSDIPLRSLEYVKTADLLVLKKINLEDRCLKTAGIHRDYLKFSEHLQTDTLDSVKSAKVRKNSLLYVRPRRTYVS